MKLLRLPNGAWVDPATITSIRPLKTSQGSFGDVYPSRVCIDYGNGMIEMLNCDSDEDAVRLAGEYAAQVNNWKKDTTP